MLRNLSEEVLACYAQADACACKAETATNEEMRDDFLRLETSWLFLARSYEFAKRLAAYIHEIKSRGDWPA